MMNAAKIFGLMCGIFAVGLLTGYAGVSGSADRESKGIPVPLSEAVKKNDLAGAEKCLAQGADVNAADEKGLAPLHYAAA